MSFPNQILTADKIIYAFERNDQRVFLFAEPQVGKTGVVGEVVKRFISNSVARNRTWQIGYFVCISDNQLLEQTRERFEDEFGLSSEIKENKILFAHASNIDKIFNLLKKPSEVQETLFILDEGHLNKSIRKGKGANLLVSKAVDFLLENSIDITLPCREWGRFSNHVSYLLEVSATFYGEETATQTLDRRLYQEIFHPAGPGYTGIRQIFQSDRFVDNSNHLGSAPTENLWEIVSTEYKKDMQLKGKGHCVLRTSTSADAKSYRDFILKKDPNARVKIFFSGNESDPDFLSLDRFQEQLSKDTFVQSASYLIIIQGLRAGKTLSDTKNIRCWVETTSGQNDTLIQSVGRNFGYGKKSETFSIICDTNEIKKYIGYLQSKEMGEMPILPSGTANTSGKKIHKDVIFDRVPIDIEMFEELRVDKEKFWKYVLEMSSLPAEEKQNMFLELVNYHPTLGENSKIGSSGKLQKQKDTMSSYVLDNVLRAKGVKDKTIKCPYLDAPAAGVIGGTDKSWEKISQDENLKRLIGKVIVPIWESTPITNNSKLKTNSIYRKNKI
jgi:hypothetical protein